MKNGMKGLDKGHDPHMLGACDLILDAWEDVSERTLARCWIRADILPRGGNSKLISIHGKVKREKRLLKKKIFRLSRKCYQRYKFRV